jgi:ATP-dependent helicase HepA
METTLPKMISAATKMVEEQSTKEIKNGLQRMNLTLNHEIDRLKILQQKNFRYILDSYIEVYLNLRRTKAGENLKAIMQRVEEEEF